MRRMLLAVLAVLAGASAAPAQANDRARVWTTTGDRQHLLDEGSLSPPVEGAPTITVDPGRSYQRIEGFGASITDSSAHLLAALAVPRPIMRDLFAAAGIGLSYLRQPMGASDFARAALHLRRPAGPTSR